MRITKSDLKEQIRKINERGMPDPLELWEDPSGYIMKTVSGREVSSLRFSARECWIWLDGVSRTFTLLGK